MITIDEKLITQYRLENPNELTEEALQKIEREIQEPEDGTISDESVSYTHLTLPTIRLV